MGECDHALADQLFICDGTWVPPSGTFFLCIGSGPRPAGFVSTCVCLQLWKMLLRASALSLGCVMLSMSLSASLILYQTHVCLAKATYGFAEIYIHAREI